MTRKASKNLVYYSCATYSRKSKSACTKHSIREDILEKAVLLAIQKQIALVATLSEAIEEISNAPVIHTESKRINHLLSAKQNELEKLTTVTDNLYMDWRTGEITKTEYRRMKEKFEVQIEQLQEVIANLKAEKEALAMGVNTDEPYLTTFLKHKNISHLERGILVELVNTIYVHEGGELTIEFNFADQHRRILEYIESNRRELELLESHRAI